MKVFLFLKKLATLQGLCPNILMIISGRKTIIKKAYHSSVRIMKSFIFLKIINRLWSGSGESSSVTLESKKQALVLLEVWGGAKYWNTLVLENKISIFKNVSNRGKCSKTSW